MQQLVHGAKSNLLGGRAELLQDAERLAEHDTSDLDLYGVWLQEVPPAPATSDRGSGRCNRSITAMWAFHHFLFSFQEGLVLVAE